MAYESDVDLINIQQQLVEHFSLDEIKGLCFDLKIDDEVIAGATKPEKARELIKFAYRMGRIPEIVQRCAELRPNEVWNKPARIYARDRLPDEWIEPLQRLYRLVRDFNRNRSQPFSDERTRQGDEIAFTMREAAPFLFGQFDIEQWLRSKSSGKRLAAIKYLDWLQDVEFVGALLGMLVTEKPFLQFHILLAIDGMVDQLDSKVRTKATVALTAFKLASTDSDLEHWRRRILSRLGS
jgi:hypothetical protein